MNRSELKKAVDARLNQMSDALATLPDETAVDVTTLFPKWEPWTAYKVDQRLQYADKLYRVIQAHTSQPDWTPDVSKALFTEIPKPGEIPEWVQPTGSSDAYAKGNKVRHNGIVWISDVDANVWEPGVYGWSEE